MNQRQTIRAKAVIPTPIQSDFSLVPRSVIKYAEFLEFAAWSATPEVLREPGTQKEFAESIGVCQDTLTDWKSCPAFRPLVKQLIREWMQDQEPDVAKILVDTIMETHDLQAIALYHSLINRPNNAKK